MMYLGVLFCLVFLSLGGFITLWTGRKIMEGIRARSWPHTTGRIIEVECVEGRDNTREFCVRYEYQAGGGGYEGSTLHPAYGMSNFESAHRGLEEVLWAAKVVRVYYNPVAPSRSMLAPGFYAVSLFPLVFGIMFFGVGLMFLLICYVSGAGVADFVNGITVVP